MQSPNMSLNAITGERVFLSRSAAYALTDLNLNLQELIDGLKRSSDKTVQDKKTGHFVSRIGEHRVVWFTKDNEGIFIIGVFRRDHKATLR